jgi:replicative DNA helicase
VDALCVAAARMVADNPDIYAIGIDFADLMVPEDIGEEVGEASKIYRKLATLAKKLRKPIFLLCQLNSSHVGGIPHVNSIRYSRLAEAMAAMIVMGYNPDGIFIDAGKKDKKNPLPYYEGKAYLILGKSRFGFLDGVGAVRIPWLGRGGWGDEAEGWTRL